MTDTSDVCFRHHTKAQITCKVVVATYEHKHGADVVVYATMEAAEKWRQQLAAEWWDHEFPDKPMPTNPKVRADTYFDRMADMGEEFFTAEEYEVQR